MFDIITKNFMGSTITVALTGLPIVITGEVFTSSTPNVIGLRVSGGTKIYVNAGLIAFFF